VAKALKAVGATPEDVRPASAIGGIALTGNQYGQAPTLEQVLNHKSQRRSP
jgi:hypothetical protein